MLASQFCQISRIDYQLLLPLRELCLGHCQGDKVKVTLQFKGREITMQEGANDMMQVGLSNLSSGFEGYADVYVGAYMHAP